LDILVVVMDGAALMKAFWFLLTNSGRLGARHSESILEMTFAKL
jgi:hypothetical protein